MSRSIFLDRDGTLNALIYYADTQEWESPRTVDDFAMLPGVLDALEALSLSGWSFILVSNQPSYAKGKTSLEALNAIHDALERQLRQHRIRLQEVYYCYHHPQGMVPALTTICDCRKPKIGSLLKAQQQYMLDLSQCWFIGDQDSDVLCGAAAGCKTIQLTYEPSRSKRGSTVPDYRCNDLSEALRIITPSIRVDTGEKGV